MNSKNIMELVLQVKAAFALQGPEIEKLDQAIGDGDHFATMQRGLEAISKMEKELEPLSFDEALKAIGMKLLSTLGGAAGPLFASLFLGMAADSAAKDPKDNKAFASMFGAGVAMVKKRGKSDVGQKTMLDVLIPVSDLFMQLAVKGTSEAEILQQLPVEAEKRMLSTKDMLATKGRAGNLVERSIGHIDPGAKSCQVIIDTVCNGLASGL